MKKILTGLVVIVYLISVVGLSAQTVTQTQTDSDTQNEENGVSFGLPVSYREYSEHYKDRNRDVEEIRIPGVEYSKASNEPVVRENVDGTGKDGLFTEDYGFVEWEFEVETEGLYHISLDYYTEEGKGTEIERSFYINGEMPFREAISVIFSRTWQNEGEIPRDSRGNDLFVRQIEVFRWSTQYFRDSAGYFEKPFLVYFQEGKNTIRLEAIREQVIVGSIVLSPYREIKSFEEMEEEYEASGLSRVNLDHPIKFQAELADFKSSPMLAPVYDRSCPLLQPYDGSRIRLNILGGGRFSQPNMWVEYVIEDIPEDGLYYVVFKAKQSHSRGLNISRRLYINGEIPFQEAGSIRFPYSSDYTNMWLGGDNPVPIPLKEGKNVLRIESSLGELGDFSDRVTEIVLSLNESYRRLVVITGPNPDLFRDYMLESKIPDVIENFGVQAKALREVSEELVEVSGGRSSYSAILNTVALQLERINRRPTRIPREVPNLNANLASLGTWINNITQTNLNMDYIMIVSEETPIPRASANIFERIMHELRNFVSTFFEDYSTIGDVVEGEEVLEVWINSGRDQAQILKQMIDSGFTPESNIGVDLKLVQGVVQQQQATGALLQATVAGIGPDVALTVMQGDPINFAIRNAVLDLNRFDDFEEVKSWFSESTMTPMELNGKYYGLPERAMFPMLFYRKDILDELGIPVPETWEDIYRALPILQGMNMNFGLPVSDIPSGIPSGIASFGAMLYQRGGQFYNEDRNKALFDEEVAVQTMRDWSNMYISYGMPLRFDFVNRFSSGEMPIAVVDYAFFNVLTIFAPQIRNLWGFTLVPGTVQEDGSISHIAPVAVMPCMILRDVKNEQAAWEFLKWWVSGDVQSEFGREIEYMVGEAGRYPAANLEAIERIPWPTRDLRILKEQFDLTFGIPEVPGGYYTWRHLDNAFREIIYNNIDAREVMVDYNKIINEEIETKLIEFGLR